MVFAVICYHGHFESFDFVGRLAASELWPILANQICGHDRGNRLQKLERRTLRLRIQTNKISLTNGAYIHHKGNA